MYNLISNEEGIMGNTRTYKSPTVFQNPFSQEIWESTYKDHNDRCIDDTFHRVASAIASVETTPELQQKWASNFFEMLQDFKVTVGGRIYSNAGTEWKGTTLMNCFVGPQPKHDVDSLTGILEILDGQAKTLKAEGGWGNNFSTLRPRGAFIHGIGVESPGSVKYMELFDKSSEIITSGPGKKTTNKKAKGKIRKGAMMGVIDIWHPDVVEFITAKQSEGRLNKFNMSVNVSDEFMSKLNTICELEKALVPGVTPTTEFIEDVAELDKWNLFFPDTQHPKYKKEWDGDIKKWQAKGYAVVNYQTVSVKWLWNLIMESTYNRAEPGVLFLDRANEFNPLYYGENITSTNPCGEQTLSPGNVCNLGSVNLSQFINVDRTGFEIKKLEKYVSFLVRFLDNVNSYSDAPLPEYIDSMRNKRRIGVGILGWGTSLFMMKVRFGSEEADKLRDTVMKCIAKCAYMSSIDLAVEKGAFKYCDPVKHSEGKFIKSLDLPHSYMTKLSVTGIRNSSCLSIQPTGNTSLTANNVSGGLEPIFMPEYVRTVIVATVPEHIAHLTPKWYEGEWFETAMFKQTFEGGEEILRGVDEQGVVWKIDKNRGLTKEVLCEDYAVKYLKARNEWDPSADWAVTTLNLSADDHVKDLKGFTRWIDSACSKTINVPNDYPFEDFKNLYLDAYKTGYIKGLTTYRSGTMSSVLSAKEEKLADDTDEEIILDDVSLPDSFPAEVKVIRAEGRKWYLTVHMSIGRGRPLALFVHTNNTEKNVTTEDAIERLFALAVRKKIPDEHIQSMAEKVKSDNNPSKITRAISLNLRHGVLIKNIVAELDKVDGAYVGTFIFQIRKYLSTFIRDGEKVEGEKCIECGSENVVFKEGCKQCMNCGSSKCG